MKGLVVLAIMAGGVIALDGAPQAAGAPAAAVAQDTVGRAVFAGKGLCTACHGPDAKGTPLAPDLTDGTWLHVDGSVEAIARLVKEGVAQPKEHPAPMPPMGGAQLTDEEIQAVARYVASLSPGTDD